MMGLRNLTVDDIKICFFNLANKKFAEDKEIKLCFKKLNLIFDSELTLSFESFIQIFSYEIDNGHTNTPNMGGEEMRWSLCPDED
jgi:hypothetical protein